MSSPVLFPLSCNSTVRYLTKTEKPQIKKKRSIKGTRSPFLEFHAVSHLIIKQPKYNLQKHRRCCVCAKTFGGGGFSPPACRGETLTFCGFVFDGLLEEGDVFKRAEEQNHLVVLVPDGSHLHVEPHGTSCERDNRIISATTVRNAMKASDHSVVWLSSLYRTDPSCWDWHDVPDVPTNLHKNNLILRLASGLKTYCSGQRFKRTRCTFSFSVTLFPPLSGELNKPAHKP